MEHTITKAVMEDHEAIFALYRRCTLHLESLGINQWDETYPSPGMLRQNIKLGFTWIINADSGIVATTTLDGEQDEKFFAVQWAYPSEKVLVIHRLCVDPMMQGRGLAKTLVSFAEQYAHEHGFEVIRLDAFLGNPFSQKLYKNLNYQEAIGYCYYPPDDIMCNCFEKKIWR